MCAAVLAATGFGRSQTPAPTPSPAATSTIDVSAFRIRQIFTADHLSADWFNQRLLDKLPLAKIEDVVGQLKFALGQFKDVRKSREPNEEQFPMPWGRYLTTFKDGTDEVYILLDGAQKINGLSIKTPHTSF